MAWVAQALWEWGCKWRGLPKHFGNGHTIYSVNPWAKNGVVETILAELQHP
ncbi:MAG: hypothetical protein BRC41_06895 [Cyanobacteria bacterium QH_9_48_43]|nr:MAG: hypothetical protein BRC41_06895 [Cyanobacteria bacterium QH_9_48_43]